MIAYGTVLVIDANGEAQLGKTVVFYPAGTSATGVLASELGLGLYKATFNSSVISSVLMVKSYDVWVDGTKRLENIRLDRDWEWVVEGLSLSVPVTVAFNTLTDIHTDPVPIQVDNGMVEVLSMQSERPVVISNITGTGFDATPGSFGSDPTSDFTIRISVA